MLKNKQKYCEIGPIEKAFCICPGFQVKVRAYTKFKVYVPKFTGNRAEILVNSGFFQAMRSMCPMKGAHVGSFKNKGCLKSK